MPKYIKLAADYTMANYTKPAADYTDDNDKLYQACCRLHNGKLHQACCRLHRRQWQTTPSLLQITQTTMTNYTKPAAVLADWDHRALLTAAQCRMCREDDS